MRGRRSPPGWPVFLHDDVGQVLSAIGLQLDVLRMDLRAKAPEIVDRTAEIQQLLGAVVERLRNLSYELNPSIVERAGFQFALDRLIGRYRDEFHGSIRFLFDSAVRLPTASATMLYKDRRARPWTTPSGTRKPLRLKCW